VTAGDVVVEGLDAGQLLVTRTGPNARSILGDVDGDGVADLQIEVWTAFPVWMFRDTGAFSL
jgi:hypothetical protein